MPSVLWSAAQFGGSPSNLSCRCSRHRLFFHAGRVAHVKPAAPVGDGLAIVLDSGPQGLLSRPVRLRPAMAAILRYRVAGMDVLVLAQPPRL
ncbi:hypothetical protein D3C71_1958050 [compost metagenome]